MSDDPTDPEATELDPTELSETETVPGASTSAEQIGPYLIARLSIDSVVAGGGERIDVVLLARRHIVHRDHLHVRHEPWLRERQRRPSPALL